MVVVSEKAAERQRSCTTTFVDSSQRRTRRAKSSYIIFFNIAPFACLSMKQTNVETTFFGAEFVAMKLWC